MTVWSLIVLACLLPAVQANTYCTAVETSLNILNVYTQDVFGVLQTEIKFDNPRPNYSRFLLTNRSQTIEEPSFAFGQLMYTNFTTNNPVNISGIGGSGLVVNSNITFQVQVTVNNTNSVFNIVQQAAVYQGTIYNTNSQIMSKSSPCFTFEQFEQKTGLFLQSTGSVCCARWHTVTPPTTKKTCTRLQSNATFINGNTRFAMLLLQTNVVGQSNLTIGGISLNVPSLYTSQSLQAMAWLNAGNQLNYNGGYSLPLSPAGNQVDLTTEVFNRNTPVCLVSSLGYFEYHEGLITGFHGHGLTEAVPCVTQNLPYLPRRCNSKFTHVTSVSTICCTKFDDIEVTKDIRENKSLWT